MENLITKSNALVDASYRLSLNEARVLFYGLSLINPLSNEFPLEYVIEIKKFADMFNLESHNIYETIKDTVMNRFWEREFSISIKDNTKIRSRWLISIEYNDHKGLLKIFFHPKIQPFLHQLKENFTSYYLEKIAHFKSIYSVRFYELSIMHINMSKKEKCLFAVNIADIKKKMGLEKKYSRFSNFKLHVLEIAKSEINKHSDLHLSYKIIKLGRSPHQIEFTVTRQAVKLDADNKPSGTQLTPAMLEKAKALTLGTGWDIYDIEQQFYEYVKTKGQPENLNGAFIGFVKKKIQVRP